MASSAVAEELRLALASEACCLRIAVRVCRPSFREDLLLLLEKKRLTQLLASAVPLGLERAAGETADLETFLNPFPAPTAVVVEKRVEQHL